MSYQTTFNTEGLSTSDVCTLFREAQENRCKVSFAECDTVIVIGTNDKQIFLYFNARRNLFSGECL